MLPRNGTRIEQCRAAASESSRVNNVADSGSPELTVTRVDAALACAQLSTVLATHLLQRKSPSPRSRRLKGTTSLLAGVKAEVGPGIASELTLHRLAEFRQTPETYLSLLDLSGLIREVDSHAGRLDLLPPTHETLARVIIAQTSNYSSHPLLFGPPQSSNSSSGVPSFDLVAGPAPPPFADLREYGRRRASLCHELREAAIRCVWEKGAMAKVDDDENAASCWILGRQVEGELEASAFGRP